MIFINTTQTPATAEPVFQNFWLHNAESCRNRLRHSGSVATSAGHALCDQKYWCRHICMLLAIPLLFLRHRLGKCLRLLSVCARSAETSSIFASLLPSKLSSCSTPGK